MDCVFSYSVIVKYQPNNENNKSHVQLTEMPFIYLQDFVYITEKRWVKENHLLTIEKLIMCYVLLTAPLKVNLFLLMSDKKYFLTLMVRGVHCAALFSDGCFS